MDVKAGLLKGKAGASHTDEAAGFDTLPLASHSFLTIEAEDPSVAPLDVCGPSGPYRGE